MALTTLADLKTFLGIEDSSQDVILTILKDSVEQSIINYCETDFTTKVVTNEILSGTKADVIVPLNFPIISVQAVFLNVDADGTNGFELDDDKDYYNDEGAIYLMGVHTPNARGRVRIDYTWGYAAVPADVKLAVYQGVKVELQRYSTNTEAGMGRSKGDESETGGSSTNLMDELTGLPKTVVAKLQAYKVYEFPNINMAQRNL